MPIVITSLRTACQRIMLGELKEGDVIVVANTKIRDTEMLEKFIKASKQTRWNQLSNEQAKNIVKEFAYFQEGCAREVCMLKRQNAENCAEICRRLFKNGQVFQYRLVLKTEILEDPYLWRHDCQIFSWQLNVADYSKHEFSSLEEYVNRQREENHDLWIRYLFPDGLKSCEQLKQYITII